MPFRGPTWSFVNPSRGGGGGVISIAPAGVNAGQILINPQFMQTAGDYVFLDAMKTAEMPWFITGAANQARISPADVDTNGYPTSLTAYPSGVATALNTPGAGRIGQSAQHYVLRFDGTGTMTCSGSVVSGSLTGTGPNNRVVMNTTGNNSITIGITALPVTNVHFYHIDDEPAYLAGKIAGTEFTARIKQAQSPVFRILNWLGPGSGGTNLCNITTWATRKSQSYATYFGDELRSSLFAGTTTNSGNDYSITFGSGAPTDKQIIHLYFNASQSDTSTFGTSGPSTLTFASGAPGTVNWGAALPASVVAGAPIIFGGFSGFNAPPEIAQYAPYYVKTVTGAQTFTISATNGGPAIAFSTSGGSGVVAVRAPSLNLNSTGAVPIWDQRMQIIWGPAGNLIAINPGQPGTASSIATLVYDAGINVWTLWGGTNSVSAGIGNGVSIEAFVALCAEVGCHPWFCSPQFACDPMTDWHRQLATYCNNNAPAWMVPRFECLNEPWNHGNSVSDYAAAKSFVNWGTEDIINFVGKIASTIGQDISAVYGGTPGTGTKYHLMINPQTGNSNPTWNDGLNSSLYVGQAAAPQSGYVKAAAKNYLTHVAINQYMNSAENQATAAIAWNTATGGTPQLIIDAYMDGTGPGGNGFTPTGAGFAASSVANPDGVLGMSSVYTATFSWCQGFTNTVGNKIRMCGYEGGLELQNNSFPPAVQLNFWNACMNLGTNTKLYCTQNYNNFIAAGGEHPALFQLSGLTQDNSWSCLIDIYQSPDPLEWQAVASFA